MYKTFFGLTRNPFEITPDPRFFYGTARHNEALASLYHGIERRKGFIVVTGEVGTGKTLLARCLFQILKQQKISFAYVFNPLLPVLEFLQYAASDMGLPTKCKTKSEVLIELNRYLISQYHRNSTAALIVDEAQLLNWEMLEEIRLLTNLETAQQKLLQIVLIGQPELDEKLESQDLRQLKQRISLRCRLQPLSYDETRKYISVRLRLAGAKGQHQAIFSDNTVELIHRYSQGIPRLVNTICEGALVSSFAVKSSVVLPELVEEIAADFRLLTAVPSDTTQDISMSAVTPAKIRSIAAVGNTAPATPAL
jgi:general secretion pathway protein A